jgi:hypothetical protein
MYFVRRYPKKNSKYIYYVSLTDKYNYCLKVPNNVYFDVNAFFCILLLINAYF